MRDMELHKVGSKGGIRFTAIHPNSVWIDFNGHVVLVLRKVSQINQWEEGGLDHICNFEMKSAAVDGA